MKFALLVDDQIKLLLVHETFAADYEKLASDNFDYLSEWLAWPQFCKTQSDFKQFIQTSLHKYAQGESLTCAIEYCGEIVGNCSYNTINHELSKVEIGYWIAQNRQGNGIVSRVCKFLINYAFDELGVTKVQISVAEHNQPSRKVCERLGFKLEGIISNQELINNKILNHAIYALHSKN
ncbi:MAG: GNAT family N-acetyltransferase [bacterium]